MDALKEELKKHIIEELNLQDITPDDIIDDAPLFGEGLGLDSIDALELIVIMENYYGIPITDASVGKEILYSIDTMAAYIVNNKPA
ncbi:MAG: acyl carrier protein [Lewinellaceae bacterium]|nr:acyl carrier protein [Lewinellaceae bacterium]